MGKHRRIIIAAGLVLAASTVPTAPAGAAPIRGAGHVDMAWTVTDASGAPPPDSFGRAGGGRWAGADRIWNQPGFTGAYRITVDGVQVAGYCGDFHNGKHPDAASSWMPDPRAFLGSDKALTKLSYAQWRWGATTDPDVGAALNLYTHFLGSPHDRSNSNGVPVPDINDNDVLDEIVTTLAPHADVGPIMSMMDAEADAWSTAFDHRSANVATGVSIDVVGGNATVTATATGRALPQGSYDLERARRQVTAVTAGVARPVRDVTAGSQNSITAGTPQLAQVTIPLGIGVASQISDVTPAIGSTITDHILVTGLLAGETATVTVELFDLTVDPAGEREPLATETRSGLVDGTTIGWTPFDVTAAVAGHRLGYRHRLDAIAPPAPAGGPATAWSELGIASETGTVDEVDAVVHLRKLVSSLDRPSWVNAQRGSTPSHSPVGAPPVAADGSHDDQDHDDGDALPVYAAGAAVTFRYEVWLDDASTADVAWPGRGASDAGVVVDDAGTDDAADDFSPALVSGDDGDGLLSVGEVWVFETQERRRAEAGEQYSNLATVVPGRITNPITGEPTDRTTAVRVDPAGYSVPCLSTSVADPVDGDRTLDPAGGVVVDIATYCNLIPGEQYVIDGVAVVQATGEPTEFRGSTSFTPDAPHGTVAVEIAIDASRDASSAVATYVVFETITVVRTGDAVASHADLDDDAQTFHVLPQVEAAPPVPPVPPVTTVPRPTPTTTTMTTTTTTTPTTTTTSVPVPDDPPPVTVVTPPPVAMPPSIPKVGSDTAQIATVLGILLLTVGVVLMEVRHGRIRPQREPSGEIRP